MIREKLNKIQIIGQLSIFVRWISPLVCPEQWKHPNNGKLNHCSY